MRIVLEPLPSLRSVENMATSPSLEEVLIQRGLKREDLELACPRDVRNKVAVELVDWKMLGHCFDFSRAKLEAIHQDNQTEDQRKVALLDIWSEREGKGATYLKLAEVLHQRKRGDLVETLCGAIKSIIPAHIAVKAEFDAKSKFNQLCTFMLTNNAFS